MDFVPVLVIAATIKKLIDLLHFAERRDWKAVRTQVVAWVGGVLVVLLASATDWAGDVDFGGVILGEANVWSQILAGIAMGSAASLTHDAVLAVRQDENVPPARPGV